MSETKEVPKGWRKVKLAEFIVKGGGSIDPSKNLNETFELFSIPAYSDGRPEIKLGSEIGSTKKVVKENDILLSRIVPHIQRSWVVPKLSERRQIGSSEWIIFRGQSFVPLYMRYFLLSYEFHRKLMTTISGVGGSLTRANPNLVALFEIPLPPIPEQLAIVDKIEELLSELDKGKQQLQIAQQQLTVYKQSLLKWAFEGKLTNKKVKDGELPKGWKIVKLSDLGIWKGGGTPSKQVSKYWENGTNLWVTSKDMKIGVINDSINKITDEAILNSSANRIPKGAILFVMRSGILRHTFPVAIAGKDLTVNQDLQTLSPNGSATSEFIYWFIRAFNNEIRQKCSKDGTTVESIESNSLKNYPFILPPLPEQQLIVSELEIKLTVCDKIEETISQSLLQTETLRQSILKKAFEGKLISTL